MAFRLYTTVLSLALLVFSAALVQAESEPIFNQPDDRPPVEMFSQRTLHDPPPLDPSPQSVRAFIRWAGMSAPEEREDGRAAIAKAASNPLTGEGVALQLCNIAKHSLPTDHTRALLVLSILGELKSPAVGFLCMIDFLWIPAPKHGTFDVELGGFIEAESLAMVQAQVVDGLAYLRNPLADVQVLLAIALHPSRTVRAEAIQAFLWNHGDDSLLRLVLQPIVALHGEEIFLDRIRREDGEAASAFDAKLMAFLAAHPGIDEPERPSAGAKPPKQIPPHEDPGPPPLEGFVFGPTCSRSAPQCSGTCDSGQICVSDQQAGCYCATGPACIPVGDPCSSSAACCAGAACVSNTCIAGGGG